MRKIMMILTGLFLIIIGCILIIKDTFGENIEKTAEQVAVNAVATKINESVEAGFYNDEFGENLIKVERDADGNIQYLEANSRVINKLLLSFSRSVEEKYSLDDILEIKVNYGHLTGNRIVSQLPFYFKVRVHPVSLTKFQCDTDLETEGINQTRYHVYCTVTSRIHIVAPFTDREAEINRKILIAEAVIVGKVPDNYVMVPEESILDAIE